MVQALIPMKDLVSAKTRLSGLLSPAERRALAQAMVEDVIATLIDHPLIDSVTLVSDDPGADLLACKYRIDAMDERSLGCRGLNPVLEAACDRLMARSSSSVMVLHGDIPLLSSRDIDAVIAEQQRAEALVIGCDRFSTGTNLLAFSPSCRPQFAFGPDSCARHQKNAVDAGFPASVVLRQGIGLDVDEPADLAQLIAALGGAKSSQTARLLLQSPLGSRIEMLLQSLDRDSQGLAESGKNL